MRACILSIGSEIMLGQITDTNASWLADDLHHMGIDLVFVTQVGDNRVLLQDALTHSLSHAEMLICTGGIGPTDDDMTREAIAEYVGETPRIDATLLENLTSFFSGLGRVMPEKNAKQAWTIPSCEVLPNPIGTAPGWFVRTGGDSAKTIVAMPGVPREMFRMWSEQAKPRILAEADGHIIDTTVLKTFGIGESDAEARIHDLILKGDPEIATYAKDDGVHIRVTAFGTDADGVRSRREQGASAIQERLGSLIWGRDDDSLAGLLSARLNARGWKLSIEERGTGGAMANMLAVDPRASTSFDRIVIVPGSSTAKAQADHLNGQGLVGLELNYRGDQGNDGISEGTLVMRLDIPGEATKTREHQLRGSLQDIQRRAGMHAVQFLIDSILD